MTRTEVKVQERAAFDLMVRTLGVQVDGDVATPERPDFFFKLANGRSVGLEVVRALDEYIARGRGARNRIKERVKQLLIKDAVPVNVHISLTEWLAAWFAANNKILQAEAAAIATLAQLAVSDGLTSDWRYYRADLRDAGENEDPRPLRPHGVQYLTKVALRRIEDEPWCGWSLVGTGQSSDIVQDAINDKAEKLDEYRTACPADEYWLIVIGSAATGGALDMTQVERRRFTSPFDRTVFIEAFEKRCAFLETDSPDYFPLQRA